MPKPVVVNIPHDLTREEAEQRLRQGFQRIREQIGGKALAFEEQWEDGRLSFSAGAFGQKVTGRVDVMDKNVRIEVDLPWILGSMAEKLQGRLKKTGRLLLEKK